MIIMLVELRSNMLWENLNVDIVDQRKIKKER